MSMQDRKQREFERRGQEILTSALSLFETDDWEHVTVEQISRQAEVGKGTIYKHFSSKDEIYACLVMQFQQRILTRFLEIDADQPVVERFRQHLRAAWEVHLSSEELHRVFLYCSRSEFRSRLDDKTASKLQDIELEIAKPTNQLVAEGIMQGIFPPRPLELLLFGAQSAFWGAIQLIWSGYLGGVDRKKYLDEITSFILAGLIFQDRPVKSPAKSHSNTSVDA